MCVFIEYFGSFLHNYTLTIKLGVKRGLDLLLDIDIWLLNVEVGLTLCNGAFCLFSHNVFTFCTVNFIIIL